MGMENTTHHLVPHWSGSATSSSGRVMEMVCEYCGRRQSKLAEIHGTQDVTAVMCPKAPGIKWVEEAVTE